MEALVKEYLSMAVLGHVDAGKSTLAGHLLHLTGAVSNSELSKFSTQSEQWGKASFKYFWIINKSKVERERGITFNIYHNRLKTQKHIINMINVPGHRCFMKTTIRGIVQADVALLVVSGSPGQFQAGIAKEGQTLEHALLAYTFGINQLVVCINKMDSTGLAYSENKYNQIKRQMTERLKKVGYYYMKYIIFVPISAWNGDNLVKKSDNMPWYQGPTLLEAIDQFKQPKRQVDKPLRMIVSQIYKISGVGTVAIGRAVTGSIQQGQYVIRANIQQEIDIGTIQQHDVSIDKAQTGHCVGVNLKKINHKYIKKGEVIGSPKNDPPKAAASFIAQILVIRDPMQFKVGYTPVVFCHEAMVACRIEEVLSKLDKRTGKKIEDNPSSLKNGQTGLVKMRPLKLLCVQKFSDYQALGRISIWDQSMTVGVGIIKQVEKI